MTAEGTVLGASVIWEIPQLSAAQVVAESCTPETDLAESPHGEQLIKTSNEELSPSWGGQKPKASGGFSSE